MVTGFDVDGQRIARAQLDATKELAHAIRELTRTIAASQKPEQANSFVCVGCGGLYSEESGATQGFTCENCLSP